MGLITSRYEAQTSTALTITLASLVDGGFRESTAFYNNPVTTPDEFIDCLIGGKITVGTNPTLDSLIKIWLYGTWDQNDFSAGVTGVDAAYSAAQQDLLIPVEYIKVSNVSDVTYEFGGVSVREAYGLMPPKFGILVGNETGVSLNATASNHDIRFFGLKYNAA